MTCSCHLENLSSNLLLVQAGGIVAPTLHELIEALRIAFPKDSNGNRLELYVPEKDWSWFHPSAIEATFGCPPEEVKTYGKTHSLSCHYVIILSKMRP